MAKQAFFKAFSTDLSNPSPDFLPSRGLPTSGGGPQGGGQRRSAAVYAFVWKARFPSPTTETTEPRVRGTRNRNRIQTRPLGIPHSRNCRGTRFRTFHTFTLHFHPASAAEPAFASPSTSSRKLRRWPPPWVPPPPDVGNPAERLLLQCVVPVLALLF